MTVGKIEAIWTYKFTPAVSGSLFAAYAHAWANRSGVLVVVDGVGTFAVVSPSHLDWTKYGVQIDDRLNDNVKLQGFAKGLAGTAAPAPSCIPALAWMDNSKAAAAPPHSGPFHSQSQRRCQFDASNDSSEATLALRDGMSKL